MAIGVIATIKIQEGKNADFEAEFAKLAEQVHANEPNTVFYALHRSQDDSQTYKVLEQYKSQEDLQAHMQTDYYKQGGKKMAEYVAAAPEIELLDSV